MVKTIRWMILAMMLGLGLPSIASAQAVWWSNGVNAVELRSFDGFLYAHPGIGVELNRDPALAYDPAYLARHPELREFLATHPGVRAELVGNPRWFVAPERPWYRREWARNDYWRWRARNWYR